MTLDLNKLFIKKKADKFRGVVTGFNFQVMGRKMKGGMVQREIIKTFKTKKEAEAFIKRRR